MKFNRSKIAAILAWVIGAMAIVAGGQVLLGRDPGYSVIGWLPVYNFSVGLVTFLFTAILLWRKSRYAMPAVIATFSLHTLVMIILQLGFRQVVATESIFAMTIRMVVWVIIIVLLLAETRKG
jgi:uncharacterized membrane protein